MRRFRTALFCVALMFPFGSTVHAQDPDYARSGAYVGAGGFGAFENFDGTGPLDVDDSWGLNARVGYRFHPRFAAEIQYEWYDDFEIDVLGFTVAEVDGWSLTANGKAYLLTGRIQPYALLGGGYLEGELDTSGLGISADDNAFMWRFGGGFDIYAVGGQGQEHIVLSLEATYLLPIAELDDLEFWTIGVGLQYRF